MVLRIANYLWLTLCLAGLLMGGSSANLSAGGVGYLAGTFIGLLILASPALLALSFLGGNQKSKWAAVVVNAIFLLAPWVYLALAPSHFSLAHILLLAVIYMPLFVGNLRALLRHSSAPAVPA